MKILSPFKKDQIRSKFADIFNKNSFNGTMSVSGPGSDLIQTQVIRNEIPELFKKYNIKSFIDAPCGDFFWMQYVDLGDIKYTGIDIVSKIIQDNKKKYQNPERVFICRNIISDKLPSADLILIRDCWVHLNNSDIFLNINNLKRNRIKYVLTTSFTNRSSNKDLDNIWRPLNLELPPFDFPAPIVVINENCTENDGVFSDKSLLLWAISSL